MVLISHRYKFIYLKNYKTASTSVEAFFSQFCIDPVLQSSYEFNDRMEESITPYGIVSSRYMLIDNNRNRIQLTAYEEQNSKKTQQYVQYKTELHNTVSKVESGMINNSAKLYDKVEKIWFSHKHAIDIKDDIGDEIFNQYLKFCVVRNPYDSIVSSYHWNKHCSGINMDFKKFCIIHINSVSNNYFANDMSRIFLNDIPVCDYYIRYENLKEDIHILLRKLGITDYDIEKLPQHKSKIRPENTPYQSYYDDETKNLVYKYYKKMIDYFGYTY